MKTCKELRFRDNKYQECLNPVEDEIRAWGQIINPVRCKDCRAKKRYFSRAEQDKRRSIEISNHYKNHELCSYEQRGVPCVAFDY